MSKERFIQQLQSFQQRLLEIDARNPAVFTGKLAQRRSFDLHTLGAKVVERAFAHTVASQGRQRLIDEQAADPLAVRTREHLRRLAQAAEASEEETGLRDLRLATFWLEGKLDSRTFVRAPLLLFGATLERQRGSSAGWYLELPKAGELMVNSALLAAIRKALKWSPGPELWTTVADALEELHSNKRATCTDLLTTVSALLTQAELPLVGVDQGLAALTPLTKAEALQAPLGLYVRGYALVGLFPQSSTALFQDYDELIVRAQAGETDQGIVDNLLEVPADGGNDGGDARTVSLDDIPASAVRMALPCDPSQHAVLREAQSAECTVVRGPPGTGKSQVIANMVVDALSRGERVLVVCQKRAALDVVQARLRSTGLTPWSYLVHDAVVDRADVYEQLLAAVRRSKEPPPVGSRTELDRVSAEVDGCIAKIRGIVEPLSAAANGRPLVEWYRRAPAGQRIPGELPKELIAMEWPAAASLLELLQQHHGDARELSGQGSPVRERASWARFGMVQCREILAAIDTLLQATATSRGALVLVDRASITTLREALAAYRAIVGRWWKFLSPRWWRSRKQLQAGQRQLGIAQLEQWDPLLDLAAKTRTGLDNLGPFFSAEFRQRLEAALQSGPQGAATLEDLRAVVHRDFERIVDLDQHLGELEPWAQRMVVEHDPPQTDKEAAVRGWRAAIERDLCLHWIDRAEARFPALRGEPFAEYRRQRERLVKLLAEQATLTARDVVHGVWTTTTVRDLPQGDKRKRPDKLWTELEHQLTKLRRVWPLRKLLREYSGPLNSLARCWMLSPEVAAEILPLQRAAFDLVIFDEASQLPLERAVPVLYRARRVVIAGDEQQMPPGRFFQSVDDEEELVDEEGAPVEDARQAESLLVQAKKIYGFRYLSWHYRSESGELIEFSNQAFYDGNLHITPSMQRRAGQAAIVFHPVDGVWDQQINLQEASACVELIRKIATERRAEPKSIGVVTVNQKQQQAIEDGLHQVEERDPGFAALMHELRYPKSGSRDDAFIVKNIENIQGDERDIIIFSTAFARPPDRRPMRRNFGAIGKPGGENRLNVAFTRARCQMHILCSFDPGELMVDEAKNRGPRVLKAYLQYAKAVSEVQGHQVEALLKDLAKEANRTSPTPIAVGPQFESDFEKQVYEALRHRGLQVDTRVGVGSYRIDLAVVDPRDPARYCLAVECDGATYHSGRSVRERDVARQHLLERRGWACERIWSRDWWRDPQREVERIAARVDALLS